MFWKLQLLLDGLLSSTFMRSFQGTFFIQLVDPVHSLIHSYTSSHSSLIFILTFTNTEIHYTSSHSSLIFIHIHILIHPYTSSHSSFHSSLYILSFILIHSLIHPFIHPYTSSHSYLYILIFILSFILTFILTLDMQPFLYPQVQLSFVHSSFLIFQQSLIYFIIC